MKKLTILALAIVLTTAVVAPAQENQILFVSGNAWQDGGFPGGSPGANFEAVGILNDIDNPLTWLTELYSYTWHVRDLVLLNEDVIGPVTTATYSGGLFTIYVDWLPSNHNFGVNPPNATVPSSFVDGISTYLDGFFTDFTVQFNTLTQAGVFSGTLNFTGGDVFPLLNATDGWTFGSNLAGVSPTGYDLQVNGSVFLEIISVEEASWGGIKALYQ